MSLVRLAAPLLPAVVVAALLGLGCAAERPPASESTTADTLVATISASSTTTHPVCAPGAVRECRVYWVDENHVTHCNLLEQACRADGFAWQPCGELDAGPAPNADAEAAPGDAGEDAALETPLR